MSHKSTLANRSVVHVSRNPGQYVIDCLYGSNCYNEPYHRASTADIYLSLNSLLHIGRKVILTDWYPLLYKEQGWIVELGPYSFYLVHCRSMSKGAVCYHGSCEQSTGLQWTQKGDPSVPNVWQEVDSSCSKTL